MAYLEHEVDLQTGRDATVDLLQKMDEFALPRPTLALANDFSHGHVQTGK